MIYIFWINFHQKILPSISSTFKYTSCYLIRKCFSFANRADFFKKISHAMFHSCLVMSFCAVEPCLVTTSLIQLLHYCSCSSINNIIVMLFCQWINWEAKRCSSHCWRLHALHCYHL